MAALRTPAGNYAAFSTLRSVGATFLSNMWSAISSRPNFWRAAVLLRNTFWTSKMLTQRSLGIRPCRKTRGHGPQPIPQVGATEVRPRGRDWTQPRPRVLCSEWIVGVGQFRRRRDLHWDARIPNN